MRLRLPIRLDMRSTECVPSATRSCRKEDLQTRQGRLRRATLRRRVIDPAAGRRDPHQVEVPGPSSPVDPDNSDDRDDPDVLLALRVPARLASRRWRTLSRNSALAPDACTQTLMKR